MSWRSRSACLGHNPSLWYPTAADAWDEPRAICRACPVSKECLDEAIERREPWGMWGGMNPEERRASERRRIAFAAAQADDWYEQPTNRPWAQLAAFDLDDVPIGLPRRHDHDTEEPAPAAPQGEQLDLADAFAALDALEAIGALEALESVPDLQAWALDHDGDPF